MQKFKVSKEQFVDILRFHNPSQDRNYVLDHLPNFLFIEGELLEGGQLTLRIKTGCLMEGR